MNPFELPKPYREALGVHEGLRKLGFASADIYFGVGGKTAVGAAHQVVIALNTQGKSFIVVVGFLNDAADNIERTWIELATAVSDGQVSQKHLDRIWQESMIHDDCVGFVASIVGKGFTLPRAAEQLLN